MKILMSKEEVTRAILIDIFTRTGMRLEQDDVNVQFLDNAGYYKTIDEVEINTNK